MNQSSSSTGSTGAVVAAEPNRAQSATSALLAQIEAAVRGIRFGSVLIVIQDGMVVQIETTEKLRLR